MLSLSLFSKLNKRNPKLHLITSLTHHFTCQSQSKSQLLEIDRLTKLINDHPITNPLDQTLKANISSSQLSNTHFIEHLLGNLFASHTNGLKAYEFFKFTLNHSLPSSDSIEKTLHILTRMRYFDKAWDLLIHIAQKCPALVTLKAMSIFLSRVAKFGSFEDTLLAFERFDKEIFVGREFGVDEFNVLLRAFCTQRQMKEAKAVFGRFCFERFRPNVKTMNILLLGFKESGDVTSVELFYHEMVKRGFKGNAVSYNVRIDVFCKRGCLGDALRLLDEMEKAGFSASVETLTTLVHGAGVVRNVGKARELFDEIGVRGLVADVGAYNALLSSLVRCRDVKGAMGLMNEMEEKGIGVDNVTYHTMFFGMIRGRSYEEGVSELFYRMLERKFVPKTRTVVMLMKFFCLNGQVDMGLKLWDYLIERGYCPHSHALDLIVTGLCARGGVEEAYKCSTQMLERGRHLSEPVYRMLQHSLREAGEEDKMGKLDQMIKKLQMVLPSSRGCAVGNDIKPEDVKLSLD